MPGETLVDLDSDSIVTILENMAKDIHRSTTVYALCCGVNLQTFAGCQNGGQLEAGTSFSSSIILIHSNFYF